MMAIIQVKQHIKIIIMKQKIILVLLMGLFPLMSFSQTVGFPTIVNISNSEDFVNNVVRINDFPYCIDNQHPMPSLKNKRSFDWQYLGLNLQNNVPMVCLDDFRYGHKFDNPYGEYGIGYLSLAYWLPSNGNYMLFYCILDNGMDYYREFLVTTSLSGAYVDHLLVRDGWSGDADINFTQAKVNSDLTLDLYEIKNLNTNYVPISDLTSFTGQKVTYQYTINTSGHFVLNSTVTGVQRTYNISELQGLISNLN